MKFNIRLTLFAIFAMLATTGCEDLNICEAGEGFPEDFPLEVSEFNGIDLSSDADVTIVYGEVQSVVLRTQPNLAEKFEVEVRDGVLSISNQGCIRNHDTEVFVTITQPLATANISGSGDIVGQELIPAADEAEMNISGSGSIDLILDKMSLLQTKISGSGDLRVAANPEMLESNISGSGTMKIIGEAVQHQCTITGSGDFFGYDLSARDNDLEIRGSGSAQVFVAGGILDVTISGSGDVFYRGTPASINAAIDGSGTLTEDN
ncbi:head GIN domain-containing protein [Pontibacter sp. G13]|uniref:head GIN domain-containing protein n=1 Tax=Pontibacter sp. G13 TaxID=3074898 RepID=UPI002889559E|nr:head GIN domain-containing protein [Pontibacter sp. G13]WNJ18025.1 head GIN domain-containing protein [Pontibacter sp. G13]